MSNKVPLDPIALLEAVPSSDVQQMQRTIAEHAHCMHYAVPTPRGSMNERGSLSEAADAFEITLIGAWFRSFEKTEIPHRAKAHQKRGGLPPQRTNLCAPLPTH